MMKKERRVIMPQTPQDYLTDKQINDLRESVEFSLQSIYAGQATLFIESHKPSEWSMTVPVFASSIMLVREAMEERSLNATH